MHFKKPTHVIDENVGPVKLISEWVPGLRTTLSAAGLVLLLSACLPEFSNLKGEYIRSSPAEDLIAETEALIIRSPKNYKALYFHLNTQMRICLADTRTTFRGYILDSLLEENMERGELATIREKKGFGYRAETHILVQSGAEGSKVVIHTRADYQLEKWVKWIRGEKGCFPELYG